MDDKQLLSILERQRYRATALDISLKTGATVEDSEEALAQLLAACGGSYEFRGETVVYIFPHDVKRKLGARRANAQFQRGLAALMTAAQYAVGAFVLLATLFVAVVVVLFVVHERREPRLIRSVHGGWASRCRACGRAAP